MPFLALVIIGWVLTTGGSEMGVVGPELVEKGWEHVTLCEEIVHGEGLDSGMVDDKEVEMEPWLDDL